MKTNPKKSDKKLIEKLKKYIRENASNFLKDSNISSVGIGFKISKNIESETLSIQFTVDQKLETDMLETIGTTAIPEKINVAGMDIPTDIIQRSYKVSYQMIQSVNPDKRKIKMDPMQPGISICNSKGTAGTLGCLVYDQKKHTPYLLSNWHVFHGDDGQVGDPIVQPGPYDDNRTESNICGQLVRSYLGVAGDCAISSVEGRQYKEEILDLNVKVNKICEPELNDRLVKSGRTTGVTYGVVKRVHCLTKIHYGNNTGYKEIGSFELGIDPDHVPADGEISMGGDSGSVWMVADKAKATDIMAGLHFAGESSSADIEHALACYPKSVFEKLGITTKTLADKTDPEYFRGHDPEFLNTRIEAPRLKDPKVAYQDKNGSGMVHYTHFSLALHKQRRMAIWVMWDVDGKRLQKISRKGLDFKVDPDIDKKYQIDNALYKNNRLDRGHIARRADLTWGSMEEAAKANRDSFYYTNIVPQMDDFNQSARSGIWGKLEDEVYECVDIDNLRISVISGPVFQDDDKIYRKVQIPREFFKVLIYKEKSVLKCKAFILSQNINRLEILELDEFRVYEVPLEEIEQRCSFMFDKVLMGSQKIEAMEDITKLKPLGSIKEILW